MSKGVRAQWEKAINTYGFESYDEEALQAYLAASPKLLKKAMSGAGCWGPYRGGSCGSCGNVAASMEGGDCGGMKMRGGGGMGSVKMHGGDCGGMKMRGGGGMGSVKMHGGDCGMKMHGSGGMGGVKMHGGRIALAGEYFGLKTSPLVDQAAATDMTQVTDNYVRPAVSETFFTQQQQSAPSCGGGWQHDLFAHALKTYRAQNKGLRFTAQQKGGMQTHFDQSFDAAFKSIRKVASKTKHLKVGMVEKAFKKN